LLPAHGARRARVALFTGCVADVLFRTAHWATARVLQRNGCEVIVPRGQVCCGALPYHAGLLESTVPLIRQNLAVFDRLDVDAIVVNVAGCGSLLKDYGHAVQEAVGLLDSRHAAGLDPDQAARVACRVRDVTEFLAELGPIAPQGPLPLRAVYHDACHLSHAQKIRSQPRQLLQMIPELKLLPLEESEICCGAAGAYALTQPELSDRLAQRKAEHILASRAQAVFTANAGCLIQIDQALRRTGHWLWVAHPIEALDRSYQHLPPPLPGE
jgi:glycolate oxidase iron-sulfur subunit